MFNGTITGRGLSDLMVGAVGSLEHGVPNLLIMDMNYIGLYGQDAWRLGDRVTLITFIHSFCESRDEIIVEVLSHSGFSLIYVSVGESLASGAQVRMRVSP